MQTYDGQEVQVLDYGVAQLLALRLGIVNKESYCIVASLSVTDSTASLFEKRRIVHEVHYFKDTGAREVLTPDTISRSEIRQISIYAVIRELTKRKDVLAAEL